MSQHLSYAFRSLLKNKTNSIITIVGMAVAIACVFVVYVFVIQGQNFNSFHEHKDRIYRIQYHYKAVDIEYDDTHLFSVLQDEIKQKVSGVVYACGFHMCNNHDLKIGDHYENYDIGFAGADFFKMFTYPLITSLPEALFTSPYEAVITKHVADSLLNNSGKYEELLGDSIEFSVGYPDIPIKIVGILDDLPGNSTMQFDVLVSNLIGDKLRNCSTPIGHAHIYYMHCEDVKVEAVQHEVHNVVANYYDGTLHYLKENNLLKDEEDAFRVYSVPVDKVHKSQVGGCNEALAVTPLYYILGSVAFLILLIAGCNYVILTLGQYFQKIGDVGVRKVMGATNKDIFTLFFIESLIITTLFFIVGILLGFIFIPTFEKLSGFDIHLELISYKYTVFYAMALFFLLVIVIGSIPVFLFKKVSPHQMAANKMYIGKRRRLSHFFVSLQYSITIILIIITVFLFLQLKYLINKPLGFNSDNIHDVDAYNLTEGEIDVLAGKIEKWDFVENVTKTSRDFRSHYWYNTVDRGDGKQETVYMHKVDENYLSTLELKLIAGRDFTAADISPDSKAIVVNRTFTEVMGIVDNPIGKEFIFSQQPMEVIGVVEDYHFINLGVPIFPMMLHCRVGFDPTLRTILIQYKEGKANQLQDSLQSNTASLIPDRKLNHKNWNVVLKGRYRFWDQWSHIIGIGTILAILVSSLGLFGLTLLLIQQRVKEIGIRRVNGASMLDVLLTINKSFATWLMGAYVIACPVAYYLVDALLYYSFAYHIATKWWVFAASGIFAFLIALITVSWHSIKAVRRNPVEALRYE